MAFEMPSTSATMLSGLRAGQEGAWDRFYAVYAPIAYRFARKRGLGESDCEDVVAIVMRNLLVAFRRGLVVDYSRGRFRHYFRAVVNHAIGQQLKRRGRDGDVDPQSLAESEPARSDAELVRMEARELVRLCIEQLKASYPRPRDVVIFERYVIHEEPPAKLAKLFNVSRARIYAIRHEVLGALRRYMAEQRQEFGMDAEGDSAC